MFPLKHIADLIHKLVIFINGLGQPKVNDNTIQHETISAVKVKTKTPEPIQENNWVIQKSKGVSGTAGYSGTIGNSGMSTPYGTNATGAVTNPYINNARNIKLGGKYFDPNTFQEVFPDDLKDLLDGGDNIVPTDMWQMDLKKKSIPKASKIINKK